MPITDGTIAQLVVILLETEPEPGKGYYGLAIQAADEAYRIKKEQHHGEDGKRSLVSHRPGAQAGTTEAS